KEGKIVAYTRCFAPGIYFKEAAIGRVVVSRNKRKYGYGHVIMKASLEAIKKEYNTVDIKLSAQMYLKNFYESHGFTQVGEGYLEDGIPHIAMILS
ncbi:MAG: GNAT family N-acetyltransferase, partial [Flavobacteriaceae bacterium]|nr:GNAT family N-acetyltransferase [Flavobacteriaceae bacterium]